MTRSRRDEERTLAQSDLWIVIALAPVCALVSTLVGGGAVRTIAGLALSLVLPGYALMSLVFRREGLGGAEKLLVAAGASLSLLAVGGLALDLIPGRLSTATWAVSLATTTVVAALVALFWPRARDSLDSGRAPEARMARPMTVANLVLAATALAIVTAAVAIASHAAARESPFLELSTLPVHKGDRRALVIVKSRDAQTVDFRLVLAYESGSFTTRRVRLSPSAEFRVLSRRVPRGPHGIRVALYAGTTRVPALENTYFFPAKG